MIFDKDHVIKADFFVKHLNLWHQKHPRFMPWSNEKDPYLIWISEIILQQTRVAQGWNYYLKFKNKFPDIQTLANASEDEVLKLWQGMGYYSRARNLLHSSKIILQQFNGKFPNDYAAILSLKGVGSYTAAAIASFAFNQFVPVLDGNVFRVLARYFGISLPIDSTQGKLFFNEIAKGLIDKSKQPGVYNQAIMNFGAIQCVPKNPNCKICVLQKHCHAYLNNSIKKLPIKSKKIILKHRYFHFLFIKDKTNIYLEKRADNDIWKGLYTLPMIEDVKILSDEQLRQHPKITVLTSSVEFLIDKKIEIVEQKLTHQKITAKFFNITLLKNEKNKLITSTHYYKIKLKNLNNFAFPKMIVSFLKKNVLVL